MFGFCFGKQSCYFIVPVSATVIRSSRVRFECACPSRAKDSFGEAFAAGTLAQAFLRASPVLNKYFIYSYSFLLTLGSLQSCSKFSVRNSYR